MLNPILVQSTPHQEIEKSSASRVPIADISERCPFFSIHLKQHNLVENSVALAARRYKKNIALHTDLQVEGEHIASYPLMIVLVRHHRLGVLTPVLVHPNWSCSVVLFAATTAWKSAGVQTGRARSGWLFA